MKPGLILLILGLVCLSLLLGLYFYEESRLKALEMRLLMYSPNLSFETDGYYNSSGFYCVWTKGQSNKEIELVEEHEVCHSLINADSNHFCN